MTIKSLETILRERLTDTRAMTGVLNINADRVFLDFGQIGPLGRIRLRIRGNEVAVVYPEVGDDGAAEARLYGAAGGATERAPEGQDAAPGGEGAGDDAPRPGAPDTGASGPLTPPPRTDPDEHSRDALIEIARAHNASHRANATKAEIAAAIDAARGL